MMTLANQPRVVSQKEAKEFVQHFGMDYIETSAKTGQNIDELLPFLASRVYILEIACRRYILYIAILFLKKDGRESLKEIYAALKSLNLLRPCSFNMHHRLKAVGTAATNFYFLSLWVK